ncbi:PASTA domain-containing protein [Nocardiopsis alba]|uniref:PASTA domain-containing protein n=1 Tax=Nocardiopsis alba TaxID=53437 RepID=UPI00366D10DE
MTPDPLTGLVLHGRVLLEDRIHGDDTVAVYSGKDTTSGLPVTVTLLAPAATADPATAHAFLGRAQSLAGIDAPGLVRSLGDGRDGDHVYMVTGAARGESLAALLTAEEGNGRYGPRTALSIVADVLAVLAEAHDQGFVHGGPGPEDVLLDEDDRVLVTGVRMVGAEEADPRTDVRAVGVLLYTLLTGEFRVGADEAPRPSAVVSGLHPDLDMLVANATDPNPRYRPRDAGRYLTLVEQVLRSLPEPGRAPEESVSTRPIPVVEGAEAGPTDPRRPSPPWRRIPVLVGAGVLVLVLFLGFLFLGSEDELVLPDLVGLSVESAEDELESLEYGLRPSYEEDYSDDVEPGAVAVTDPAAGAVVERGSRVLLSISVGPRYVEIPDVVGESEADARDLLRAVGFTSVEIVQEHSSEHDPGTVLSSTPEVGEEGDREGEITLNVSEGTLVPSLVGMARADAVSALEGSRLRAGVVETPDDTAPEGEVIGQDPEPGTIAAEGREVVLTVSSGPDEGADPEESDVEGGDGDAGSEPGSGDGGPNAVCSGQPWKEHKVYDDGDVVHYEGRFYEARWWVRGDPPSASGEWGPWADQGPC